MLFVCLSHHAWLNTKAPAPNPETTIPDASPLLFGNQFIGMVRVGMMARFWGEIYQLLNIILKLRIIVLLPVSNLPYVVKVIL
jgi:hypothetical protein